MAGGAKPYKTFMGRTEVRVVPKPSISTKQSGVFLQGVGLNVGGTYVELSGIDAEALGQELIDQARRPLDPSVASLYAAYMDGGEVFP